jgi:hypothetical protein
MTDDGLMVFRLVVAIPFAATAVRNILRPDPRSSPARRALVAVQMLGAVGLMGQSTAWASAVLALACLLVPVGAWLVRPGGDVVALPAALRGLLLAMPAALVVWEGYPSAGPDLVSWLAGLSVGQIATVLAGAAGLTALSTGIRGDRSIAATAPVGAVTATPGGPVDLGVADAPGSDPLPRFPGPALISPGPELTIGMAVYDDFDGVYFTIQALRLYHDLERTELLVVDNHGSKQTEAFVRSSVRGRYILAPDVVGTAAPKDLVFRKANGRAVLCCDSHVLFAPGSIARLKRFYRDHPDCGDLLQGPLVYDDGEFMSTHFDPVWRGQMWGVWATDERGLDRDGEPFDIPMQGLGVFSCRAGAWPGFHPGFRGFGGEEGYLHEKFRQAGQRCLCLPWLRWMHRFGRPHGVPYPLTIEDKLRNYLLGHAELGLDPTPVLSHFSQYLPSERIDTIAAQIANAQIANDPAAPVAARPGV